MNKLIAFTRQIKRLRKNGSGVHDYIHFRKWKKNLQPGRNSVTEQLPWLSFKAIDYLKNNIKNTHKVFEYGGGGSTLFWNNHVAEISTVEHDEKWFAVLKEQMEKNRKAVWNPFYVPAGEGDLIASPDASDPDHFTSEDSASKQKNYKAYVLTIQNYPDEYFDIILIDGRARTSCLKYAFPKLKKGGLLILDNAERLYYTQKNQATLDCLDVLINGMGPVIFSFDFSETRIYRKK